MKKSHKTDSDMIADFLKNNIITECKTITISSTQTIKCSSQRVSIFNPTENKKQKRNRSRKQLTKKQEKALKMIKKLKDK